MPTDIAIWTWLFDSPHSAFWDLPEDEIRGYRNSVTDERIKYSEVKRLSTYIHTAMFRDLGLKAGETVSLFSNNTIWYPVAMFGVVRGGGVISGASPAYGVEEMAYALKTAKAKFLFTVPKSMEVASKAAAAAGLPKENVFLLEGEVAGYRTLNDLTEMGRRYGDGDQLPAWKLPAGKKNGDILGYLSFSSGTTGLPKAVCLVSSEVRPC